jgi:hypothetical protein
MSNNFKKMIYLPILLAAGFKTVAQTVTLELPRQGADAGIATNVNGPSTAAIGPVNFWKDLDQAQTNASFVALAGAEVTTVRFSLVNQQYTGNYSNLTTGLSFGASPTTAVTPLPGGTPGVQAVEPLLLYRTLGSYGSATGAPTNAMFQSHPILSTGTLQAVPTGSVTRQTGSVTLFTAAQFQYDQGVQNNPTPAPTAYNSATKYYYGDLVIQFNRFVKDPVIHVAGLGGSYFYLPIGSTAPTSDPNSWRRTHFTTELQSNYNLIPLVGNTNISVNGGNIENIAPKPDGASVAQTTSVDDPFTHFGAATGSVLVSGTFNTLVFRVYLRGADITDVVREFAWSAPGTASNNDPSTLRNPLTGDIWQLSVSAAPVNLIPLPATGVNLSASLVGNDVSLLWKTLSEFNTNYFEIERSTDGINFARIGEKAAAGNSATEKNYTYGDPSMATSVYYYRLKMVDLDGKVTYSNIARVNKSTVKTIKTFPNPVTDVINVEFANSKGSYTLSLVNQAGQEVKAIKADITNTTQYVRMERGNLATGMYYVRVKDNTSGQVFAEKVIIK